MTILEWLTELQAIAQTGLAYSEDVYDTERYQRLLEMSSEMTAGKYNLPADKVSFAFMQDKGYVTPKMDVRAFVMENEKVLLVKESSDGLWSLPGGWVDVNESAAESIVREVKEESGYDVKAVKLLALWDKRKHAHPLHWPHVYKSVFHCEKFGGEPTLSHEVLDINFFALDNLPDLSLDRITAKQILKLKTLLPMDKMTDFD